MDYTGPAARAFEQAQCAFDKGDYGIAVTYAKEAEILASSAIKITNYGNAPPSPTFTIIIVYLPALMTLSALLDVCLFILTRIHSS